jgi:hypothetical protein
MSVSRRSPSRSGDDLDKNAPRHPRHNSTMAMPNVRLVAGFVAVAVMVLGAGCSTKTTPPTTTVTQATPPSSTAAAPPSEWVGADCGQPHAADLPAEFASLPRRYTVKPVCVPDVGPGLADPGMIAEFSNVAAGEVTETDISVGTGPPGIVVLRAFVGKLKSGDGAAFVDAFMSRLGPDAQLGTVNGVGHSVRYISIPGGAEGYAYGEGPTVVIGYIADPNQITPKSPETVELPAREAFMRILAAATGAPMDPTKQLPVGGNYPLARGTYTTPGDAGWMFFKTEIGQSCGISPDGALAGCDNVSAQAPDGTNQTVVRASQPAAYIYSDTTTFTRDGVDVLPAGRRLDNGSATCNVGYQGTVGCTIGDHKFVIASHYGVLE